jgi:two-component system response regulator AtoC
MHLGADNFLVKPVVLDVLSEAVSHTLEARRTQRRHRALVTKAVADGSTVLMGSSQGMKDVRKLMAQVAETDTTVLLLGESGTGKGVIAEEIHRLSQRSREPFMDVNCAGLSSALLESELFGHEAGAFTDARRAKPGLMEVASGGTLFLDEIGEMPLDVQSKLLKVLEQQRFRRLGGIRDIHVDLRLLAATNRDLRLRTQKGDFREDLFYRLNVFAIEILPLRERGEELLELAHHFLGMYNRTMGTDITGFDTAAQVSLRAYDWPGNVRELRNVVERAVILARTGLVAAQHLPSEVRAARSRPVTPNLRSLGEVEEECIRTTLQATGGNVKRTAEILKVSRSTLYSKISAYRIETQGTAKD